MHRPAGMLWACAFALSRAEHALTRASIRLRVPRVCRALGLSCVTNSCVTRALLVRGPQSQSDDELNRERSQCDEELGGATLRLVNAWDPASAADQGEREMPNVKGFYGEVDLGDWKENSEVCALVCMPPLPG